MPFIKFTEKVHTSQGTRDKLVFVNVGQIAKATFDNDMLFLVLAGSSGTEGKFTIDDAGEAKEALRVLHDA